MAPLCSARTWAAMGLRGVGVLLLVYLSSEPARPSATIRLVSRPMTPLGLASQAGSPLEEVGPNTSERPQDRDEGEAYGVYSDATLGPAATAPPLPAGCAPAPTNVHEQGAYRPWLAMPSRCHIGGDWQGQCGPSLPHTLAEGRRACTEIACGSCGVDVAPPDPEDEADAADMKLLSLSLIHI